MVLTQASFDHPDEIWSFLVEHDVRAVGFNIEQVKGANNASSFEGEDAFAAACRFFARLLELRRRASRSIAIREIDLISNKLRYGPLGAPPFEARSLSLVSFDVDGNASTFSPELLDLDSGRFHFGSIRDADLTAILADPRFQQTANDITKGIDLCRRSCPSFEVCGGGSPADKLGEHGTFVASETMTCRLTVQAIYEGLRQPVTTEHVPISATQQRSQSITAASIS
jgi:uncharacterized protein